MDANTVGPAVLDVAVVGAGIAGLSAAIAISRAGHHVEVGVRLMEDRTSCVFDILSTRSTRGQDFQTKWEPPSTYVQTQPGYCLAGVSTLFEQEPYSCEMY